MGEDFVCGGDDARFGAGWRAGEAKRRLRSRLTDLPTGSRTDLPTEYICRACSTPMRPRTGRYANPNHLWCQGCSPPAHPPQPPDNPPVSRTDFDEDRPSFRVRCWDCMGVVDPESRKCLECGAQLRSPHPPDNPPVALPRSTTGELCVLCGLSRGRCVCGPLRCGKGTPDLVNHPPHYTSHPSGVECIDITEHMNFCVGNAMKYLWRAGLKDDNVQDLDKAVWYIKREIRRRLLGEGEKDG